MSGDVPETMGLLARSWQRCTHALVPHTIESRMFGELLARYSEPHRKYHTAQHLCECLMHFEAARHLAEQPDDIEMALWFHDAIYDTQRHDNEEKSAGWARDALLAHGASAATAQRVHDLVMATRHTALPVSADEQLLVDIDLSILGAGPDRFAEYERQIRDEYAFVPAALFRQKRSEILQGFLDRPVIYSTAYFRETLEARARENLCKAIAAAASATSPLTQ
ncbi:HD domain-containing protein [Polaromonas aquatica]|uniref:HD domain-containing protein n=1 Tax=Polaromonas aquatica TaxID=332657 RepID=UPI003D64A12D